MADKKGKSSKAGRDKVKCGAYRLHQEREKHKVIKIARSNGLKAALAYAADKGILAYAQKRLANYQRKEARHAS